MLPPAQLTQTPPLAAVLTPRQREREQRLHRVCLAIELRRKKGASVVPCCKAFSKRWNGKPLRSEPGRLLRLSAKTLIRVYYQWRKGGKSPRSIRLRYGLSHTPTVSSAQLRSFIKILFSKGTRSAAHAYKLFAQRRASGRLAVSYSTIMRHVPPNISRRIRSTRQAIADAKWVVARLRTESEEHALASARRRFRDA